MSTVNVLHISPQPEDIFESYPKAGVDVAANIEREFRSVCEEVLMDTVCAAREVPPPGDASKFRGIVVTGSVLSVYGIISWLSEIQGFLRAAIEREIPVLGICFGHQVLADMYGVRIAKGDKGKELGVIPMELTAGGMRDPLYMSVDQRPLVMSSHGDVVPTIPRGALLLAKGDMYEVQSLAIGRIVRTVQFHPEFDPDTFDRLLEVSPPADGDRVNLPPPSWRRGIQRTGSRILKNFMRYFVLRSPQERSIMP